MRSSVRRRAFSMPELLVGIAILAFTLGAAYSLMSGGVADVAHTRDFSTAVLLAQEAVEACRGYRFDRLDEDDPLLDDDGNPAGGKNGDRSLEHDFNNDGAAPDRYPHIVKVGAMEFKRAVAIEQVARHVPAGMPSGMTAPPLKLKSVKITVSWKTMEGRAVNYEVATLVSAIYR